MFFRIIVAVTLLSLFVFPAPTWAADCQFVLGFKAIHDQIPDKVGECLENEHHNPENGDGLQATTGGLLVWRKADNWTAFTDGYRTWVNGPNGLQQRLNTERFEWENDGQTAVSPPPTATPVPATPTPVTVPAHPAGATALCRDGTYSYSQNRRGTCSWHGGVAVWLN